MLATALKPRGPRETPGKVRPLHKRGPTSKDTPKLSLGNVLIANCEGTGRNIVWS